LWPWILGDSTIKFDLKNIFICAAFNLLCRPRDYAKLTTLWGRFGFDDGYKTSGACRDGDQSR